jgi:hypothetical protein
MQAVKLGVATAVLENYSQSDAVLRISQPVVSQLH